MKAKHLKNTFSYKLVFLAVGIALAIIAAFSICATSQAKAGETSIDNSFADYNWTLKGEGGNIWINGNPYGTWKNGNNIWDLLISIDPKYQTTETVWIWQEHTAERELSLALNVYANEHSNLNEYVYFTSGWDDKTALWTCNNSLDIPVGSYSGDGTQIDEGMYPTLNICSPGYTAGVNVAGRVIDAQTNMPVPFANVVYCQYNPWWDMYLPVEGVEPVQTDMWGFYTLEGITEEMLPGKVFVYDGIKQIGESEPIWFFPEGMETLYMWPIVINQEQPDPPVPPTPPDPPVPPGPVPPEPVPPVPPVPPTPVPTPDNPGGGIAQTSDNTGNALVIFAIVALLGAGVLTGRKLYNR